jgi:Tol biopolymer transport system component
VVRAFGNPSGQQPRHLAVAPANGKLAFATQVGTHWQIVTIDPDGTGGSAITDLPTDQFHPTWSPDGSMIAFDVQSVGGDMEIAVMNADGSGVTSLTEGPGSDYLPSWSPDGSRIAFVSGRDGNDEIYVMNADGTDPVRLTRDLDEDLSPAWSPDGSRIVFQSNRATNNDIYVMHADGSSVTNLTNTPDTGEFDPEWSPDGSTIVFVADSGEGTTVIDAMDVAGSTITTLTDDVAHDWSPTWSPDGAQLAFESDRGDPQSIYVMNADGTGAALVLESSADACCPSWRPRTSPVETPEDGSLVKTATIPIAHDGMVLGDVGVGNGAVWVALYRWADEAMRGAIVRVDPATDSVVTEIPIDDGFPTELGITQARVWVLVQTSPTHVELRAIDPSTDDFVSTVQLPASHVGPLATTDDAVWLAALDVPPGGSWSDAKRSILRFDGSTGELVATIPADICQVNDANCTPTYPVVADGSVWFEGHGRTALYRVDPATNDLQVIQKDAWCGFSVGEGSVWVGLRQPGIAPDAYSNAPYLTQQIDETNGAPTGDPILVEGGQPDPITGSACPVAVGDGGVWVEAYDREMNHILVGRVSFDSRRVDIGQVVADGEIAPRLRFDFSTGVMWAADREALVRYELP